MKNQLITMMMAVTIALGVTQVSQSAEGSGVGNGGNDPLSEYQAGLNRELGVSNCGANCGTADLDAWCAKITRVLRRELSKAQLQIQYENFIFANQILRTSLIAASDSLNADPNLGGPMTKRLIDRGLVLVQALDNANLGIGRLGLVTKAHFLVNYVQLILDVEKHLDRPLYIPYLYKYGRCHRRECPGEFRFDLFEQRYIEFAQRQLSFLNNEFTHVVFRDGASEVIPLGNPKAFLVLAELVTSFVAEDLTSNLYAYAYACVVQDLQALSDSLRCYNWYGDKTVYPNDRWAINSSSMEIDHLIHQMNSCSNIYGN